MPSARLSRIALPALAVAATALAAAAVPVSRPATGPAHHATSQARPAATAAISRGAASAPEPVTFRDPADGAAGSDPHLARAASSASGARIGAALRRELGGGPRLLAVLTRRGARRVSITVPAGSDGQHRVRLRFSRVAAARIAGTTRRAGDRVWIYRVSSPAGQTARLVVVSAGRLAADRSVTVTRYVLRCPARRPVLLLLASPAAQEPGLVADQPPWPAWTALACAALAPGMA